MLPILEGVPAAFEDAFTHLVHTNPPSKGLGIDLSLPSQTTQTRLNPMSTFSSKLAFGMAEYRITNEKTSIGRSADNEIVLDHETVSQHHAVVEFTGNCFTLRDLASTNGTRVNGVPINEAIIQAGDSVSFGEVTSFFYMSNDARLSNVESPPPLPSQGVSLPRQAPPKAGVGLYNGRKTAIIGLGSGALCVGFIALSIILWGTLGGHRKSFSSASGTDRPALHRQRGSNTPANSESTHGAWNKFVSIIENAERSGQMAGFSSQSNIAADDYISRAQSISLSAIETYKVIADGIKNMDDSGADPVLSGFLDDVAADFGKLASRWAKVKDATSSNNPLDIAFAMSAMSNNTEAIQRRIEATSVKLQASYGGTFRKPANW